MRWGKRKRAGALAAHKARLRRGDIQLGPFDLADVYQAVYDDASGSPRSTIEDAWGEHGHWAKPPPAPAYVDVGDGLVDRPLAPWKRDMYDHIMDAADKREHVVINVPRQHGRGALERAWRAERERVAALMDERVPDPSCVLCYPDGGHTHRGPHVPRR